MAPSESQLKKFDNTIAKISDSIDSGNVGSTEIYEEIKNQLRENLSTIYEEWENSEFNPNFRFKLNDNDFEVETTLLNIAIRGDRRRKEGSCVPLIQCLLDKGANPNIKDGYNRTPLSLAVRTEGDNNEKVVELLLGAGADPNIMTWDCSDYETTTLYVASCYCHKSFNVKTMELLLKNGADANEIVDDRRNTVLHELVKKSFGISDRVPTLKKQLPDLVKLLIKYGASIYSQNSEAFSPKRYSEEHLSSYGANDRELVISIQKLLEKQEGSIEYHRTLFKLVDKNKDLRSLTYIIKKNGPIDARGLQLCSQVIPQMLGISDIKLAVKSTVFEGEFSQGTGGPVIEVEGNLPKYFDLFEKICVTFPEHPFINSILDRTPDTRQTMVMRKVLGYIRENQGSITKELWGEPGVSSTSTETTEVEGNVTTQHVTQKEPDKGTVKQHVKKETKGDTSKEKRNKINDTSYTDNKPRVTECSTFNSGVYSQKEPPTFSRKQKIAIAIGVITALATALTCYSLELPVLAIVASTLIAGIGAYLVSIKLYDVSVCNGASQQPGL